VDLNRVMAYDMAKQLLRESWRRAAVARQARTGQSRRAFLSQLVAAILCCMHRQP